MTSDAPILLCFDGSDGASVAITEAGRLLGPGPAVVLTVWEPVSDWEPYDPATILTAPISRLASHALELDEVCEEVAQEKLSRGVEAARGAGFEATGRTAQGKTWRTICDVAHELGASAIVVGARGLSRVESLLLGSVSAGVLAHAGRPVLVVPAHRDES